MVDIDSLCVRSPFFVIDFGLKSSEKGRSKGVLLRKIRCLKEGL